MNAPITWTRLAAVVLAAGIALVAEMPMAEDVQPMLLWFSGGVAGWLGFRQPNQAPPEQLP